MSYKMEQTYKTGVSATPERHIALIPLELMNEEKYPADKELFIKVMDKKEIDKERSYLQIKAFKGLTRLLDEANCLNERLDDWEKIQYYMKFKCRLIKHYVLTKNGKTTFHDTKISPDCYAEVKSCAGMTKKEMTDLIDCVLKEADLNIDNFNLPQQKKYVAIRNEMGDR